MKGHVDLLREELMKLKGFWVSHDIKTAAAAAVKEISTNSPVVISNENAATVEVTRILLSSHKELKSSPLLLSRLVECVRRDMFKGPALTQMLGYFLDASSLLDFDTAMKLLQHGTSSVVADFPNLKQVSVCLSLSLALMARAEPSISETSFASFQQMSALLMDHVEESGVDMESQQMKAYLRECDDNFPGMKEKFGEPRAFILYLIVNDLCRIAEDEKPDFFRDVKPPVEVVFEILADFVKSLDGTTIDEPELKKLIELKVTAFRDNPLGVEFVASAITLLLDREELVSDIRETFLNKLQFGKDDWGHALMFFHSLSLRNSLPVLFTGSEEGWPMLVMVFNTLVDRFEPPSSALVFGLKTWRLAERRAQPDIYLAVVTIEIIFGAVNFFASYPVNMSKVAGPMGILILFGIKYSAMRSFTKATEFLHKFLVVLAQQKLMIKMVNKFESFDTVFGEASASEKQIFGYEEKSKKWPSALCEMIMESPMICDDHWTAFVDVMIRGEMTPSFANSYSNIVAMDILLAVVKYKPFPSKFVVDYLVCNMTRFTLLWPIVESRIISKKISNDVLLEFYKSLMFEGFTISTEVELLRLSLYIMKSDIDNAEKLKALEKLKSIVERDVSNVKEGWGSMFKLLAPGNFGVDTELITIAFEILCHINMESIGPNYVPLYIDSVFSFVHQNVVDKISEDSLMLLRGMSKRIQNWNKFFERIAQVCQDSRMSIAMNAVDTYFASFSEQLSAGMFQKENIALFVESDFGKFVQGIERVPTLKQIVLERLAELSCNNWQSFRDVPTFETTFIPSLIQMEDSITARFVNFYSLFYKCTFVSDQIEILLRRSIEHRIPFIAKSTDDELLQDFGHLLSIILKQKEVKIPIKKWMPILQKMALQLQAPDASQIHPSIQRPFQVIPALFPIERGPAVEVTSSLSTIVTRTKNAPLRRFIVSLLVAIVTKCQYLIFECRDTFSMPESDPLIPALAIARVDDESVAFECYTSVIGRNVKEANVFIGKVMDMLPFIDCESQKAFIMAHYKDTSLTFQIWQTYFAKSSPKYEPLFFEDCFSTAIDAFRRLFADPALTNEVLCSVLDFLQNFDSPMDDAKWYKQKFGDLLTKLLEKDFNDVSKQKIQSLLE